MHKKLLVVFDTNVFLSAIVYEGLPKKILDLCIKEHEFEIAISPEVLAELLGKLKYKFGFPDKLLKIWQQIFENTLKCTLPVYTTRICRDPDDDKIIDLAASASAKYIITGDKDLLAIKSYQEIHIIRPIDFLEILKNKK